VNWRRTLVCLLVFVVFASRLAHVDLLWIEEAYGMAAGAEVLRGHLLYRDIWFDKPPLYALFYAMLGASPGALLRAAGTLLVLGVCYLTWRLGRHLWGSDEGLIAATLVGFSLVFWVPSAVIAVAPDLLMMAPHLGAVYLAVRGKAFSAGVLAGVATLCNSKGILVIPVCFLWVPHRSVAVLAGWAVPQLAALSLLPPESYWRQVWAWGFAYSGDTFLSNPLVEGLRRSLNWAGFHAVLVIGACVWFAKERDWRLAGWIAVSVLAVAGGFRFFPRYYFQLLPVMALVGARGLLLMPQRWRIVAAMMLLVPLVRFGPTYLHAAGGGENWSDTRMMQDSRVVGEWLRVRRGPGDTLLVWGYRPDIYVFSGLPAASRFLDSQPLTGVLADRHLTTSVPTVPGIAESNRRVLVQAQPTYIVDGLGLLNPSLGIDRYPDLRQWLSRYVEVSRTEMSVVYRLGIVAAR
jgi:hypothetical protein